MEGISRSFSPSFATSIAKFTRLSSRTKSSARCFAAGSRNHTTQNTDKTYSHETDVLIVGSGGTALTAALRARHHGLDVLVVEKTNQIGGSTAYSGGGVWIPNNPLQKKLGMEDSQGEALRYMENLIGEVALASTRQKKISFVENGPAMVEWLQSQGFRWQLSHGYPDYYPNLPGGMAKGGRSLEPDMFDLKKLGDWRQHLLLHEKKGPPVYTHEFSSLARLGASIPDFLTAIKVSLRDAWVRVRGQMPVTLGRALAGQLLYLNKLQKTPIWRNSKMLDLITTADGAVIGSTIEQDGVQKHIRAHKGVLLAAGGFAHNKEMRQKWQPAPSSTKWTVSPPSDKGDAIRSGMDVGAATALMDDSWWGPVIKDPATGENYFFLQERARPFSIIVDSTGKRFMNEAQGYTAAGHDQYERNRTVPAIPAWFVCDQNHRSRYLLGSLLPRKPIIPECIQNGSAIVAESIESLTSQMDVDPRSLSETITHFNSMARAGKDNDFHRGESAYENFFGDPKVGPNPNLGPIEKGPFYALKVWPGDLGTKGGLVTDEHARVLREDGTPIGGLYATGNTTASVMGRTYPGSGSTLGPALTFGFIAANHMAGSE